MYIPIITRVPFKNYLQLLLPSRTYLVIFVANPEVSRAVDSIINADKTRYIKYLYYAEILNN